MQVVVVLSWRSGWWGERQNSKNISTFEQYFLSASLGTVWYAQRIPPTELPHGNWRFSPLRKNKGLEQVSPGLLVRGNHAQYVTDGEHPTESLPLIEHEEMENRVLVHQSQAIFKRYVGGHCD